ncbi:MAG: hypothetical protein HN413_13315 [Chloroflexi bacterium]|jgi:hypothetical protein|nr:hypothetical protein [Chloroflexota bacterium]
MLTRRKKRNTTERGQGLAEAAITFPVLLLAMMGLITLGMIGFAAVNANNAANYGARMGSVAQSAQASVASNHALNMLSAAPVGTYAVGVSGGGAPGDLIIVQVSYAVPNYFQGLTAFFGADSPDKFTGDAYSYFRQEGW